MVYLKFNQIPLDVQIKIRKYLDYLHLHSIEMGENHVLGELTNNLKKELKITLNADIVLQSAFGEILCEKSLFEMTLLFEEKVFTPQEFIISRH